MDEATKNALAPGIKDLVIELNELGYTTTDSGDGSNLAKGMTCGLHFRHVFGLVDDDADIRVFAAALQKRYPRAHVEVSHRPGGPTLWALYPDGPTQG